MGVWSVTAVTAGRGGRWEACIAPEVLLETPDRILAFALDSNQIPRGKQGWDDLPHALEMKFIDSSRCTQIDQGS
jgi:hypothetical protein